MLVHQDIDVSAFDKIRVVFEGSGNPADDHVIKGVIMYKAERPMASVGVDLFLKLDDE